MKTRIAITVAALAVVLIAAIASMGGGGGATSKGSGDSAKAPENATVVTFAYSPEKKALLQPLIDAYNAKGATVDGTPVFVKGEVRASGEAERAIAAGRYQPTAWSPSSSLWGRLLNHDADTDLIARENPSLVKTPLVIAMWEPLARALGYPKKAVGWDDIIRLTLDPKGWGAVGHPEYGKMKLGHTNPDFSTAGLEAVTSQYYTAAGKREGLTAADIARSDVRSEVQDVQQSIVHYGDDTLFFTDEMKQHGTGYVSAVAVEEVTLLDFNRTTKGPKITAVYPKDGTFFSDNPYMTLNGAWVTAAQKKAASEFGVYLQKSITDAQAARYGFRPAEGDAKPEGLLAAGGVDLKKTVRELSLPDPGVLNALRKQWREDRKPANVMLVVDTSGSMSSENKLTQAQEGLVKGFLPQLSPRDRVGLLSFNSAVFPQLDVTPMSSGKSALQGKITGLMPDGETAVFDGTAAGVQAIHDLKDSTRINAVVVLSDGEDTSSRQTLDTLVQTLKTQAATEGTNVRVFTIAYGSGAKLDELQAIASVSGGKAFKGDVDTIDDVYRSISSFF